MTTGPRKEAKEEGWKTSERRDFELPTESDELHSSGLAVTGPLAAGINITGSVLTMQ